jgi:uncharacterized protein (DUF488 family)
MRETSKFYEFLPYKFGSYSFQLAEDVDILSKRGYLVVEDTHIKTASEYAHENLFSIDVERGTNLIRKAYREYPYYSINSEMIDRLFGKKEAVRFHSERLKYKCHEQTLFTIGYEGRSIEGFINELIQNGVKLLCDVRRNPLSRKFGFSKSKLEHIAEIAGIKYHHIPDLGIESDKRNSLETAKDYELLFSDYSKRLPQLKSNLEWVYSLLYSNTCIALMCYERDASMCHRHVIRDYLTDTYKVRSEDL